MYPHISSPSSVVMNSTPNPYPSYHGNFGLEWMTDEAHQHTTIAGQVVAPSQFQPEQDWVSRLLEDLRAVTADMDVKYRELQILNHRKQDMMAWLGLTRAALTTTTTPTWNIPPQPTTNSTSSPTAPYYAQTVTQPPPLYTPHSRANENAFFGYESSEITWHRETLAHAKKRYICHCGRGYTRKDSLLRHAAMHAPENSSI